MTKATGDVTLSGPVSFTANGGLVADAKGYVYGASSGVGSAEAEGVTISSSLIREAKSDTGSASAGGYIAAAYGAGGAKASGNVSLTGEISFMAESKSGAADAFGSVYGASSGLGNAEARGVAVSNLTHNATSATNGASAGGTIVAAYVQNGAGLAKANGDVTLSGKVSFTADGALGASAIGDVYGAFSGGGSAEAVGVTVSGLTRKAKSNTGGASAYGNIAAAYVQNGPGMAKATGNVLVTGGASPTDADFLAEGGKQADAKGDVYGAYSGGGRAEAMGVTVSGLTREAKSATDWAYAYGTIAAAYGGGEGVTKATGDVSVTGVSFTATGAQEVLAYGNVYGAYSSAGDAESQGLKVDGMTRSATSANGEAYASGRIAAAYADGKGLARANGDVSATGVSFEAKGDQAAITYNRNENSVIVGWEQSTVSAGAYSVFGDAETRGSVALSVSMSAESANGLADARNFLYGVRAWGKAVAHGNIDLTATSHAKGKDADNTVKYANATGVLGQKKVEVLRSVSSISATADTYAFGIATADAGRERWLYDADQTPEWSPNKMVNPELWDPDAPSVATIYGPLAITAVSNAVENNHISTQKDTFEADGTPDYSIRSREARPVLAAEYLGMGTHDTLNLRLRAGDVMDNSSDGSAAAFRVFGAETVNLTGGTLALADGSYFLNQKDYDTTAGKTFGTVTGGARATTVNVRDGGVLRIDGTVLSGLTKEQGAHSVLFSSRDGFSLGVDYRLGVRAYSGGEVLVGAGGAMTSSTLTATSGGTLAFELLPDAADPGQLTAGFFATTGLTTLDSPVEIRVEDYYALEHGASIEDHEVLRFGSLKWLGNQTLDGLFYNYSLTRRNGGLRLSYSRSDSDTFSEALAPYDLNPNISDLLPLLDSHGYRGTILEPFVNKLVNTVNAKDVPATLRQLTGENASTAVNAGLEAHRNLLGLNSGYLFGSFENMQSGGMSVGALNGVDEGYGSLRCFDAASTWKLRAVASWNRLNLSGSDGFSPYRSTNRTVLLAGEHSRGGLSLGLAAGLGWTRTKAVEWDSRSKSNDYGIGD